MPYHHTRRQKRIETRCRLSAGTLLRLTLSMLMGVTAVVLSTFLIGSSQASNPASSLSMTAQATKAEIADHYGKLPLSFESNEGQTDPQVRFLSHGPGY